MKKLLLSASVLAASIFGMAQTWPTIEPTVSEEGKYFYETFKGGEISDPDNYDFGMFWYGHDTATQPGFKAELDRREDTTGMEVTISQVEGAFQPFGFVFGDSNGEEAGGTPFVMDLSAHGDTGNVFFGIRVANLSSYDLKFRVALIDTNGMLKNTYSESTLGQDYLIYDFAPIYAGDFELLLTADDASTVEFLDETSGDNYIQFARSHNKYWSQIDSTVKCRPCHDSGDYLEDFLKEPGNSEFNWAAVKGMNITVVNASDVGEKYNSTTNPDSAEFFNYGPEPMTDAKIRIEGMWLATNLEVITSLSDYAAEVGLTVSPSPASDLITVSSDIEGTISIVNAQGVVVATSSTSTVDVSGLASGIYSAVIVDEEGIDIAAKSFVKE